MGRAAPQGAPGRAGAGWAPAVSRVFFPAEIAKLSQHRVSR